MAASFGSKIDVSFKRRIVNDPPANRFKVFFFCYVIIAHIYFQYDSERSQQKDPRSQNKITIQSSRRSVL